VAAHRQLAAQHSRRTLIAQHDGFQSLAPGDEPISGLGPIATALNVHIPRSHMEHAVGIRAENRIIFTHRDRYLRSVCRRFLACTVWAAMASRAAADDGFPVMAVRAHPPHSLARMRCYITSSQQSILWRVPLLCKFRVFGLKGIRPLNEAKRLFDCATVLQPGKDMCVTSTEVFGSTLNAIEVVTLHLYSNARRWGRMTRARFKTTRFFGRPSLWESIIYCIAWQAERKSSTFNWIKCTAIDDDSSFMSVFGHSEKYSSKDRMMLSGRQVQTFGLSLNTLGMSASGMAATAPLPLAMATSKASQ